MTDVYAVNVADNSWAWDTGTLSTGNSITIGTGSTSCNCTGYCTGYHYTYPYTYWWPSYPTTIYKYQIKCPRCQTMNWLELDKITVCTKAKCGAKLKAVTNQADYEVPVNA